MTIVHFQYISGISNYKTKIIQSEIRILLYCFSSIVQLFLVLSFLKEAIIFGEAVMLAIPNKASRVMSIIII